VAELHLAGEQDVKAIAGVPLVEEGLAATQSRLRHHGAQLVLLLGTHALEQRDSGDDAVFHEGPPVGSIGWVPAFGGQPCVISCHGL
jgi:hypothetical protein